MLLLCKNCSVDGKKVNKTDRFTRADSTVIALAIFDWIHETVTVEFIWKYKNIIVFHQKGDVTPDTRFNEHRLMSFVKMAFIEYKKMYGIWTVSFLINGNCLDERQFTIVNPPKEYIKGYQSTNSIVNFKT